MSSTTGGFIGDPAEAFTPPAAGGCCGSSPSAAGRGPEAAGTCCEPMAETATDPGAGCCG